VRAANRGEAISTPLRACTMGLRRDATVRKTS
jgi:hypothetical protein